MNSVNSLNGLNANLSWSGLSVQGWSWLCIDLGLDGGLSLGSLRSCLEPLPAGRGGVVAIRVTAFAAGWWGRWILVVGQDQESGSEDPLQATTHRSCLVQILSCEQMTIAQHGVNKRQELSPTVFRSNSEIKNAIRY